MVADLSGYSPPPSEPPPASDAKAPLLSWWAIIPAIVFVAVQFLYRWPKVQLESTVPEQSLSYFVGGILGGLLMSLAIAWIVYRVGHRSTFVSTVVFTLIIGVACLSVARPRRSPPADAPPNDLSRTPTATSFGPFRFDIPAGWQRTQPDREKTVAAIARGGVDPGAIDGILKVDVGRPALPTARGLAEKMAGDAGRVLPDPVAVDGVEGVRVELPGGGISSLRWAVVVFRDEKVYLVMAAESEGISVAAALDHVLATWRWNDTH